MAHKTLIGGTAYEISGGKTLINGTAYSIKNGKTLVGGTAYEVGFGPAIITFTMASKTYQAEEGMTWAEWEKSDYCPVYEDLGFKVIKIITVSDRVSLSGSGATIQHNGVDVMPDDVIIDGVSYETFVPGFDW